MSAPTASASLDPSALARLNRLATMARLVAGLAHELNNSLQVVGGLAELLTDRPDLPPDVVLRLKKISGQADKATTAIRQVLGYTRDLLGSDAGLIDLMAVVDQVLALRRYQLGRLGITVTVDRTPPAACQVRGDERQLTQALLNLVLNAEEALAGYSTRQLRVAITREGASVQVRVGDSGPGVPPDIKSRIFEPFFTTRSSDRAVGLGLPVSQALVEANGGNLWLAADAPGATFVMELPTAGKEFVEK
jgi:two-component system NtrC family sensor kinase